MISTFRIIEKHRDETSVQSRNFEQGSYLLAFTRGKIAAYNYVLDRLVMDYPCSVCDGEKWLMQDVESFNSSRRVHSPCRSCEGTGVCDDA
jgi:hypothetical protein